MPTLDQLRAKLPELNGLDDNQALDVIHQVYYPTVDKGVIAGRLGVKLAAPVDPNADGDFVRGFKKAMYQMPQTAGGAAALVGDMVGSDGLRDYGLSVYQNYDDKIAKETKDSDSLTNVLQGDASPAAWGKNAAGYVTGQALGAVATGGLGGMIGRQLALRGIKSVAERAVESQMAKQVAAKVAEQGAKIGAGTALGASNVMQEAGSIYPDALAQAQQEGRTLDAGDKARMAGSALAAAAVDTAMEGVMAGRLLNGGRKAGEGMARAALREVPGGMAREGITEGIQTGIERYGAGQDMTTADAIRDYVDSAGLGAVGGGSGGALSILHAQKVPESGPLSRAANVGIEQQILQLAHDPQPLISFPDGSVGYKQDLEAYLTQFPEGDERTRRRREIMGRDPETGKRQAPAPEPTVADSAANEAANMKAWGARHDGVPLDYAQALIAAPGAPDGLMIVPHPSGKKYTVVPSKWLTLDSQAKYAALQKGDAGKLPGPDREAPGGAIRVDSEGGAAPETYGEQVRTTQQQRAEQAKREEFDVSVPHGTKAAPRATQAAPAAASEPAAPEVAPAPQPIYTPSGKPFLTEFAAKRRLKEVADTHELAKVSDGWVLMPKQPEGASDAQPAAVPENIAADGRRGDQPAAPVGTNDTAGSEQAGPVSGQEPAATAAAGQPADADNVHAAGGTDAKPALTQGAFDFDAAAHEAATSPTNDLPEPTQAQKEAGNYKVGRVKLHGMDISIENPAGSVRKGVNPDGKAWENELKHHYGYIRRTEGADGDHVDAFIGPNPDSGKVFVVDQVDPKTGKFDEHKVMLGFDSATEAQKGYAANYEKGWKGGKAITETDVDGFKAWLKDGDTTKPFAPQQESPIYHEGTPEYDALHQREATNDKEVDALSDDAVRAMHAAMGLKAGNRGVETLRDAIKKQHPDDVEAGLRAIKKGETDVHPQTAQGAHQEEQKPGATRQEAAKAEPAAAAAVEPAPVKETANAAEPKPEPAKEVPAPNNKPKALQERDRKVAQKAEAKPAKPKAKALAARDAKAAEKADQPAEQDDTLRASTFYSDKTIEVDGKRRPVTNSKGQLVAPDAAGQIAFWKWFKDSAVVDDQGRPMVVYHGTLRGDRERFVMAHNEDSLFRGAYFSRSAEAASEYAIDDSGANPGSVIPAYLSIKNPASEADVDRVESQLGANVGASARTDALLAAGFDGYMDASEIVAFHPEQIKSATGNAGTFDPESADIRASASKSGAQVLVDDAAALHEFAKRDIGRGKVRGDFLSSPALLDEVDNLLSVPGALGVLGDAANVADIQSSAVERRVDGVRADAELFRDLLKSKTFREQGFGGLDVKRQRAVLAAVLRSGKNLQVLDAVVKLIPVDVVDVLAAKQLTPDVLFHDPAMLQRAVSEDLGLDVAAGTNVSNTLVRALALLRAIEVARAAQVGGSAVQGRSAGGAIDDRHTKDATRHGNKPEVVFEQKLVGDIKGGASATQVLERIASESTSQEFRDLARALLEQGLKTKVLYGRPNGTYTAGVDASMATASYRASDDTAFVHQTEGVEQLVLHELVHAATLKALAKGGLAAQQMKALWNHVKSLPNFSGEYGITNEEEFVAEAYTNPRFRRLLADTPAPDSKLSLWQKLVGIVRILLGKPAISDNVLERVMSVGTDLMAENQRAAALDRFLFGSLVREPVYHGTTADFTQFDQPVRHMGDGEVSPQGVFFFAKESAVANAFARSRQKLTKGDPNVQKVHISLRNPIDLRNMDAVRQVLDAVDMDAPAKMTEKYAYALLDNPKVMEYLRAQGYDGALLAEPGHPFAGFRAAQDQKASSDQVSDFSHMREHPAETYAVFSPNQIKSATGNSGNFAPSNPDLRASVARSTLDTAMGNGVRESVVTDLPKKLGNRLADFRGIGLQALGRRQLVDIYAGDFAPEGKESLLTRYSELMQRMDADKNEAGAEADSIADRWGKLKDGDQLADLMHDATLAQIDPDKDYVAGDNRAEWAGLKNRYQSLSPEAQAIYREARDSYDKHWQKVRAEIRSRIERAMPDNPRRASLLKKMDDTFYEKVKGVYFPLARFGDYVVSVTGKGGERMAVSFAETMNEADALRKKLMQKFPADQGYTVSKVTKKKEFNPGRDSVSRGFMQELHGLLDQYDDAGELQDDINQLYLHSMPDLSWAKHGIHRKGTPGFSQDARRAFAQNMFHGARYLAKLRYGDRLGDLLTEMQDHVDSKASDREYDSVKAQQVVDEMNKRHDLYMSPKNNPLSNTLTSLGFIFYLGLSPASAAVNLTQTPLVTLPMLAAKYGFGKASAALLTAAKQAAANKNDISKALTGDELRAFKEAVDAGVIDVSMAHDLAGIASGDDTRAHAKLRPVMKWASFMFHHGEKFNRQATLLAAYRLAREAGQDHAVAYKSAVEETYASHFDYSSGNRARVMQGNVARVVLLFKQYAQNMIYTLTRNALLAAKGDKVAQKTIAGLLLSHTMAAGVLGLPVVGLLLSAASAIGGDDDEPWDAKVALRNYIADLIGQKPAEVMMHGLSRLTPFDISGRVGLDKLLLPDVQEGLEGARAAESWMTAALGPVAGIGTSAAKGLADIAHGDVLRGLEGLLPAALRAPVKALRYEQEGVRDKTGIQIVDDTTAVEELGQLLGFSPSRAREAMEGKGAVYQAEHALNNRRAALVDQWAHARMAGDAEGVQAVQESINRYNEKNPTRLITGGNLSASLRDRNKRIREAHDGVYLPRKHQDVRELGRFAASGD